MDNQLDNYLEKPIITSIPALTSQIQTSITQLESIRSIVYNNIRTYEEFLQMRQMLSKILFEIEMSISLVHKKITDISYNYNSLNEELSKSSIINGELDSKLTNTYEQISELQYQNDLLDSQVKYYKKQMSEKENYIFYLQERIALLENSPNTPYLKDENNLKVTYLNHTIVLPEPIKKNKEIKEEELKENDVNSQKNIITFGYNEINNNYDKENDMENEKEKEEENNIIQDVSKSDVGQSNKEILIDKISTKEIQLENKNIGGKGEFNKDIIGKNQKIENIIINLCKCDANVFGILEKKYGKGIIKKIQTGDLGDDVADSIDQDLKKLLTKKRNELDLIKKETKDYLYKKEGVRKSKSKKKSI